MAKLRLIDCWAAFTDEEFLTLEDALDQVEAHAPVDRSPTRSALRSSAGTPAGTAVNTASAH